MTVHSGDDLKAVVLGSFITEVNAFKPGNVSQYSHGHNMSLEDYYRSAELTTPILCDREFSVGQRILESVKITCQNVGCNTNLGMLLLFAPLIKASENGFDDLPQLKGNLIDVLEHLDKKEAAYIYQAIQLANPGGLGKSEKYDIRTQVPDTLLCAMEEAKAYDNIALQYTNAFSDVFTTGLPLINDYNQRWNSVEWATVICYLWFLSKFTDSHIQRKFGREVAENIKIKAVPLYKTFENYKNPEDGTELLLKFDKELKKANINPGTTADLTAVSVLAYKILEK